MKIWSFCVICGSIYNTFQLPKTSNTGGVHCRPVNNIWYAAKSVRNNNKLRILLFLVYHCEAKC